MEKFIIAFASNDGEQFNVEHFGDSNYYHIYEINEVEATFIKTIENNTKNIVEEVHADPNKANGVSKMLKNHGVKVVVSKVFGPNIKRINKKFVCIIFKNSNLQESIIAVKDYFLKVHDHFVLKIAFEYCALAI